MLRRLSGEHVAPQENAAHRPGIALRKRQAQRITGFLETWADLDRAPYQVKESLYTLGSGGLQGTGVGRGWQWDVREAARTNNSACRMAAMSSVRAARRR